MSSVRQRAKGTLRLARISLSEAAGTEYAVDPEFAEWYEPFPADLRQTVEESCRRLRGQLAGLEESARQAGPPSRKSVDEILACIAETRGAIHAHHAENGCRRVLRDLQTVEGHLRFAGQNGGAR